MWLELAGPILNPTGEAFRMGDANLDGVVDTMDRPILFRDRLTSRLGAWQFGKDFNADGVADGSDFNIWFDNRFQDPAPSPNRPPRSPRAALGTKAIAIPAAWSAVADKRDERRPNDEVIVSDSGSLARVDTAAAPWRRPTRQRPPWRDSLPNVESTHDEIDAAWSDPRFFEPTWR